MKKLLLVTALAVFGFSNGNAQDVKFGVKGGVNFANIFGDNTSQLETVTAFNFGVMSEIAITKKFSFQPELLYSGQGFSTKNNEIAALSYLNLPLMGKYYITKGLSLEAGPQIGYLIGADFAGTNVKADYKKIDFSANLGLGYKLQNGLNIGVRYNLGVSNINNIKSSSDSFRNGVGQIAIGYFFK